MANFCIDCRHSSPPTKVGAPWRCGYPVSPTQPSLITGTDLGPQYFTCLRHRYDAERHGPAFVLCGSDGRYWEAAAVPRELEQPVDREAELATV